LLHTDWRPENGDFIKENSLQDSEQFKNRIRKHNIIAVSLAISIVIVFIASIIILSI